MWSLTGCFQKVTLYPGAQESPLDSGNIPVKVALLYVAEVLVLRLSLIHI